MWNRCAVVLLLGSVLAMPAPAFASKSSEVSYRFEQVWSSAVRLIRIDLGSEIRDRDETIGFVLFDYKNGNRNYPGSLEAIRVREEGRDKIKVTVSIPAMPSYIERMILDKLERKLMSDYGEPPRPPSQDKPAEDDRDRHKDKKDRDKDADEAPPAGDQPKDD